MISELAGDLVGVRWNSDSMDNVRATRRRPVMFSGTEQGE
jgi:hypothetical protein